MIGVVKAWVGQRKFGFLTVPDHADVFLHLSALPRLSEEPEVGDVVEFAVVQEARGPRAAMARIVKKRAEPAARR